MLTTLAACAFFTAQGATALLSSKVFESDPEAAIAPARRADVPARTLRNHDPSVVLRRNIFNSALGDLSATPIEEPELSDAEMPTDEVETP